MSSLSIATIEQLEGRALFSAVPGAFLSDGLLAVTGASHGSNIIVVANSADDMSVEVSISSRNGRGVAKTFTASFLKSLGVTGIDVAGGRGNDTISVGLATGGDAAISALNLPASVRGDKGNDRINTAGGNDTLLGGDGRDVLDAGDGDNLVYGNDGNDVITAGIGMDRLYGGRGHDQLRGGDGDDTIYGGRGDDQIDAGAGADAAHGQRGMDLVNGGDGDDHLWGGRDNDTLLGGAGDDQLGGILGRNVLRGDAGMDTFVMVLSDQNPDSDFDAAADLLRLVEPKADGDDAEVV